MKKTTTIFTILIMAVLFGACKREYVHPKNVKTGILIKVSNGKNFDLQLNIFDDRGNRLYTNTNGRFIDDYYAADLKPDEYVRYTLILSDKQDETKVWAKKQVNVDFERVTEITLYPKNPDKNIIK